MENKSVVYAFGVEGREYPPPPPPKKSDPCSCHFPELKSSDEWADGIQIFPIVEKFFFSLALQNRQVPSPQGGERSTKCKLSQNLPCALSFLRVFVAAHCPPTLGATVPTPRTPNPEPHPPPPSQGGPEKVTEKGATKMTPPRLYENDEIDEIDEIDEKNRRNRRNRRKYLTKSTKLTNENSKNEAHVAAHFFVDFVDFVVFVRRFRRFFRRFFSSISSFSSIFFVDFVDFVDFLSSISSFSSIFFVDFVDLKKFHGKMFGVFRRIRGQLWHCSLAVFLRSP